MQHDTPLPADSAVDSFLLRIPNLVNEKMFNFSIICIFAKWWVVKMKFPKHSVIQTTEGRKDLKTSTNASQILRFALNDKMRGIL